MRYPFISVIFFIIGIVYIQIKMRIGEKNRGKTIREYLEEDHILNFTKKLHISEDIFVNIDVGRLPFETLVERNEEEFFQTEALKLSQLKMLRSTQKMSNNDIKREFGYGNLENIATYESNFNKFIQSLINWANCTENPEKSIKILSYALELDPEFSKIKSLIEQKKFRE